MGGVNNDNPNEGKPMSEAVQRQEEIAQAKASGKPFEPKETEETEPSETTIDSDVAVDTDESTEEDQSELNDDDESDD